MSRIIIASFKIICLLCAASLVGLVINVQPVQASGTIYIRADGSIDPPTANIITFDNITYTLTSNIYDGIVVERNSIAVDGAGYTVEGTDAYRSIGINLTERSDVTIKNMQLKRFESGVVLNSSSSNTLSRNNITASNGYGVVLLSSSSNTLSGNSITNNYDGVWLGSSSNSNTLSGNSITANIYGVWLGSSNNSSLSGNSFVNDGLFVDDSYGNVVTDNFVNGKPLVYLEEVLDYAVEDAGQVILVKCNTVTVENLNLSNTTIGVELWETNNTTISGNDIRANNIYGVWLYSSSGNTLSGNSITANNDDGVWLYSSSGNTLSGNNITANKLDGVFLGSSSGNTLFGNSITASKLDGVRLFSSSNSNTLSGNNITNNWEGVSLGSSSGNVIYHNSFINDIQVSSYYSPSVWDDGYPNGGNFWSDYTGVDLHSGFYQNETGYDWVGDTPYVINAITTDRYPLMHPFDAQTEDIRIAYRNLLTEYNRLRSDFESLNSTYYDLLDNHTALVSDVSRLTEDYNALNASYHQHLQDYSNLMANHTSLQNSYSSLQANFAALNLSYTSLRADYDALNTSHNNLNASFTDYQQTTQNELANIKNILYVFIAITVILAVALAYVATKKPRTKPET